MAKKIKFALKMKDGAEVRNIEDLREHFDADTMVKAADAVLPNGDLAPEGTGSPGAGCAAGS